MQQPFVAPCAGASHATARIDWILHFLVQRYKSLAQCMKWGVRDLLSSMPILNNIPLSIFTSKVVDSFIRPSPK